LISYFDTSFFFFVCLKQWEGNYLATGSYDGLARVWNLKGELVATLDRHRGRLLFAGVKEIESRSKERRA
jgi:WD40 repeat protein